MSGQIQLPNEACVGATRVEIPTTKTVAIAAPIAVLRIRRIMASSKARRPAPAGVNTSRHSSSRAAICFGKGRVAFLLPGELVPHPVHGHDELRVGGVA